MAYSVQQAFIDWLAGLGYDASRRPAAGEQVTVERTGGDASDLVDHPQLALQTWAASEARAEDMALAIRGELLCRSRPAGVRAVEQVTGPYPFWDADAVPRRPRCQLVVTCSARV